MISNVSLVVRIAFPVLALSVAAVLVWLLARVRSQPSAAERSPRSLTPIGVGAVLWLGVPAALAWSGVLARFEGRPPPLLIVVALTVAATVALARSRLGDAFMRETPLAWLVALQAFRLPLELVMHRAASDGLMPIQMSYSGYNFDIVTGGSAAVLAALLWSGVEARWLVVAWNALGSVLLGVIVTIAIVSMPMIQAFGPAQENRWIAYFPYVWLPTVLVPAALLGHIVIWRKLAREARRLQGYSRT